MHTGYSFKQIHSDSLPREKLIEFGPDGLSNAELLAIIFMTGTRSENVLELSNRVIKEYGSRSITEVKDTSKIMDLLGLGQSKAAQVIAVFELGRRFFREQSQRLPVIRDPEDVYKLMEHMTRLKKEELRALYLNSRQVVIREELISLGSENMNIVSPKEIIHPAVELMAKGIIIVHNHPSGELKPSEEDKVFTNNLKEACNIMQVQLLDHLVISSGGYLSFATDGLL